MSTLLDDQPAVAPIRTMDENHAGLWAEAVRNAAAAHPDAGLSAIHAIATEALRGRTPLNHVEKKSRRLLTRSVLGPEECDRRQNGAYAYSYERARIVKALAIEQLQDAAETVGPLSITKYELWRAEGNIEAYFSSSICTRFGSWSEALAAAGVEGTGIEHRVMQDGECLDVMRRFVAEHPKDRPTARDYIAWKKDNPDAPGMNTIRNGLGGTWNKALDRVTDAPAIGRCVKTEWTDGAIILHVRRWRVMQRAAKRRGVDFPDYAEWAKQVGAASDKAVNNRFGGVRSVPLGSIGGASVPDDIALLSVRRFLAETGDRSVAGYIDWNVRTNAMSHTTFYARFGNWSNTLDAAEMSAAA